MSYREIIYDRYASFTANPRVESLTKDMQAFGKAYRWYLRNWLPEDHNTPIADLGCGSGRLLAFLHAEGFKNLTGVDRSREQVALAKELPVKIIEQDFREFLRSHNGHFETLFAIDIFEHCTRDEILSLLELAFSALRPGGQLIIQTINADSPRSNSLRYGDLTHEVCFAPMTLQQVMRLYGFTSFALRETSPPLTGYSIFASLRSCAWQLIRLGVGAYDLIETGGTNGLIYTRNFLLNARKP